MSDGASTLERLRRGDLAGARELRLSGLAAFPREILALGDTLEFLDLGGGRLSSLPDDIGRLHRLKVLFCSGNRFEVLPPSLGACASLAQIGFRGCGLRDVPGEALPPRLRWLTLTDNRIARLPAELGLRPLRKLMLAGNGLCALPGSLAGLGTLELIRVSANCLDTLPGCLGELPGLAWAAWAGNPAEPPMDLPASLEIPIGDVEPGEVLGEGASGRVQAARWRPGGTGPAQDVALKRFKGAMTSDGLPELEMAACLAAGTHPNLTGGLGRLVGDPESGAALLMRRIPADWRPLANPPSLETCSRDVYDPATRLSPDAAGRALRGVASAIAHLHARGLSHGDVYAHNILADRRTGEVVLSDFGAASRLPPGPAGDALRRVEVRAWGILLGEVLDRLAPEPADLAELRALERACTGPDIAARPLMPDVLASLDAMRAGLA